jgi:peptidoglycan/xylan/chitin deacetylase (PgdA/CDA1 family)
MSDLRVVMYHYVRDLRRTRYPSIKGRDLSEFKGQLNHFARHYNVVTAQHVIAAICGDAELPHNAIWLTFDDGYIDHFTNVFPLLQERGWQGSFFAPARVISERAVLDVNKVHFLLASQTDGVGSLIDAIETYIKQHAGAGLNTAEAYHREFAVASRFDSAEVRFVKRLLQDGLPDPHRTQLLDVLFARFVTSDEKGFAGELYLSEDQVRAMLKEGMYFGSHGFNHVRLAGLSHHDQCDEVDRSLAFLRDMGSPTEQWIMCYPYGSHEDSVHEVLRTRSCSLALTTEVGVARTDGMPLALPRLDTNDFPTTA